MPEIYPRSFPQPLLAPYRYNVDAGIIRTLMEGGRSRQRQLYREMPQTFELTFVIPLTQLNTWQTWVNQYAYEYMQMELVSWMAEDQYCAVHMMRFISNIEMEMLDKGLMQARVGAQAEPPGTEVELWMRTVIVNGAGSDGGLTREEIAQNIGDVSAARKPILDAFVDAEKLAGTWPLTDDYWLLWGENVPQALTSLKQRRLAVAVGAPTFLANRHYVFNGTSQLIDTGFIPATHGRALTATSARLAVYCRNNLITGGYAAGVISSGSNIISMRPRTATTVLQGAAMYGQSQFTIPADSLAYSATSRTGSTTADLLAYRRGVALARLTTGSFGTALPAASLYIGALNITPTIAYGAYQVGMVAIGAALTPAQELAQYNNVQAMATAIGAQV